MTAATLTLTDFLLARIAEDEAVARAGISGQADPENGWGYGGFGSPKALTPHVGVIHEAVQAAHITRWHPGRVLAECAAKREMVNFAAALIQDANRNPSYEGTTAAANMAEEFLGMMVSVYADHSDFDPTWQ